jgi:5'-methylthioadenosine phosphorylase
MDIIGMTNYQEAKLALEAEISYATIALVTDYDCWHPSHENVDVSMVVSTMKKNVANVQKLLVDMIPHLPSYPDAPARNVLKYAIQIEPSKITLDAKKRLTPIIGKYFPA